MIVCTGNINTTEPELYTNTGMWLRQSIVLSIVDGRNTAIFRRRNGASVGRFYRPGASGRYSSGAAVPWETAERGYNQAACLARALGRSLELPVDEKLVKRVRNTAPMKHLNPTERQNNLKKAFIIGRNDVKLYDRIILVDDIYTTGTTLDEIAALLKEHGVSKVYCVTLACGSGV